MVPRQLREERDRVQAARAECPPDRARELALAKRRAAELEQARRQALADLEAAHAEATDAHGRAGRLSARDRLALAEHRVGTLARQADQAAERVGMLRRHQQQRAGWLEAHDAELRRREQVVARQLAWQRRVDERAMALAPPTWLVAELDPMPEEGAERAAWLAAAVELDAYRRVHGLPEPAERTQRVGALSEWDTHAVIGRDPTRDGLRPQHAPADRDPPGGPAGRFCRAVPSCARGAVPSCSSCCWFCPSCVSSCTGPGVSSRAQPAGAEPPAARPRGHHAGRAGRTRPGAWEKPAPRPWTGAGWRGPRPPARPGPARTAAGLARGPRRAGAARRAARGVAAATGRTGQDTATVDTARTATATSGTAGSSPASSKGAPP